MTTRDDDLQDAAGAYALDALEADERSEFEALMTGSERLRAEATELTDTAVELGLSVAPIEPPASLRAAVLAAAESTPQLTSDRGQSGAESRGDGPAERRAAARWYRRPVGALVGVAAASVLAVSAVFGITQLARPADPVVAQIAAIEAADDAQRSTVRIEGGGTATLVWSVQLERSALIVDGMPGLPAGSTYELWYIDADGATPAGTFDPGDDGDHSVVLAGAMDAGDTIGVTVEPDGGSDVPTTDPVIVVQTA